MHFLDDGQQAESGQGAGDRLVGRIMAAEYNLAVQRGDLGQATGILAMLAGQFLSQRENQ